MSFSAARQTIYAILSAVEMDLREFIKSNLESQMSIEAILGDEVAKEAAKRAANEGLLTTAEPSLAQLLYYIDFPQAFQTLNRHKILFTKSIAQYLQLNTKRFEELGQIRNRIAHTRPLQFDDLAHTIDHAQGLCTTHDMPWVNLRSTLNHLEADPSYVLGIQIPKDPDAESDSHKHNLPTPDFDETGFLGRQQQVQDLLKLCRGPFPVITIVGEGGYGKTALALKVAYDLLDQPDCPFEAIVWTSSKTTQLTAQEIVRVENAIRDSLGLLTIVAEQLGGSKVHNAMEEVLGYLQGFKILLILDNLETVLDERIRTFLGQLPAGSKVLITSRIGIGAFEYPVKLQPLIAEEAVLLLRAIAKSRGVTDLVKTSNLNLTSFCSRMKNNPGYIKWFVSAVQTGKRPEEVLAKPDLFLDFCMSNVYNFLGEHSRVVLRAMLSLPENRSQAELAYITELDYIDLQRALQQLLSTNMVVMTSTPHGSSYESHYGLGELARTYLLKHHPVSTVDWKRLNHRKQQMVAAGEEIAASKTSDPYSVYSITTRSRSDLIVAKYLRDALIESKKSDHASAAELVNTAKGLAPEYFEVHRIEAWVAFQAHNYSLARSAYEAAIELEPKSAPLRYLYAGFLLRCIDDTEGALAHFKEAAKLDPQAYQVELEIARCHLYLKHFDDALAIIEKAQKRLDLPVWASRKMHDLHIQAYVRRTEHFISLKDNYGALSCLESLRVVYEAIPNNLLDNQMREKLAKAIYWSQKCEYFLVDATAKARAHAIGNWLDMTANGLGKGFDNTQIPESNATSFGVIDHLPQEKQFGFIRCDDNQRIFFHRSAMTYPEQWHLLSKGIRVAYSSGSNQQGLCAQNVAIAPPSIGVRPKL